MVLAEDTPDAVASAGGLVFDAVRAGWHVDLYLERRADERALRILGVAGRSLSDGLDYEPIWPDALFFAASLHGRVDSVRRLTKAALRRRTEIATWGQAQPPDLETRVGVEHRLSRAAQAFKACALEAAGATDHASTIEEFRSGGDRSAMVGLPLAART
jgi:hypothetical protein